MCDCFLFSSSNYTLGEVQHQWHLELVPRSTSKNLLHFLQQTQGLCSTFPCVLHQDTQALSCPGLCFRRISRVVAPHLSAITWFSFSSSWWGRRRVVVPYAVLLGWYLGIQQHLRLLSGPLIRGHSSVSKLGVLPKLSWKVCLFLCCVFFFLFSKAKQNLCSAFN